MIDSHKIRTILEQKLSPKRFKHSIGVAETAVILADKYGVDAGKAYMAGLLHDYAKDLTNEELLLTATKYGIIINDIYHAEPQLLHGPVGAFLVKDDFTFIDVDIFNSIYYHTTGRANMSKLESIIYVADIIEPSRDFPAVNELRKLIGSPLNVLVVKVMDNVIKFLINEELIIDPHTIEARNAFYNQIK